MNEDWNISLSSLYSLQFKMCSNVFRIMHTVFVLWSNIAYLCRATTKKLPFLLSQGELLLFALILAVIACCSCSFPRISTELSCCPFPTLKGCQLVQFLHDLLFSQRTFSRKSFNNLINCSNRFYAYYDT